MKRFLAVGGTLTALMFAGSLAAQDLNVTVGGMVDFNVVDFESFGAPPVNDDPEFLTFGRVKVSAAGSAGALNYGGQMHWDMLDGIPGVFDNGAHIWVSGRLGTLQFGTNIDGYQGVFNTSYFLDEEDNGPAHISAGPLSVDREVSLGGNLGGDLTGLELQKRSTIVYTTPDLNGLSLAAESDVDGEWGASLAYKGQIGTAMVDAGLAGNSNDVVGAYARGLIGDLAVGGFIGKDDDSERYYGAALGYAVGPVTMTLEGSIAETDQSFGLTVAEYEEKDIAFGASYHIAPGLELSGSVKKSDNDMFADDIMETAGRLRLTF